MRLRAANLGNHGREQTGRGYEFNRARQHISQTRWRIGLGGMA